MSREYDEFVEDCKFIAKDKDSWIFKPLYEMTRRLVILYEKVYEVKRDV